MVRRRSGQRRYVATFYEHNGTIDESGHPTYSVDTDWLAVVVNWPVEVLGTGGGETVRGLQVTAETTHLLYGEYHGGDGIKATQRCVIDGEQRYNVVSELDPDGFKMERRVELKREE